MSDDTEIRIAAINGTVVVAFGAIDNPDNELSRYNFPPQLAYDIAREITIAAMEAETQ